MFGCLDLSNYTTNYPVPGAPPPNGGALTPDMVRCWQDNGYNHVIIGTQWYHVFRHQAEMCLNAGMSVDAYTWLYWHQTPAQNLQGSIDTIKDYPVGRHWLDAEQPTDGRSQSTIVSLIGQNVDYAAPHHPLGIYTAAWWWPGATGNSGAFSYLPLWHAAYFQGAEGGPPYHVPGEPEFAGQGPYGFKPYGGWWRPYIWQYAGSIQYLCSSNLDLNQVDGAPPAEVDMPFVRYAHGFHDFSLEWLAQYNNRFNVIDNLYMPEQAKGSLVRLQFWNTSPMNQGELAIYDHVDTGWGSEAGRVYGYGIIDVLAGAGGEVGIIGSGGASTFRVAPLGYTPQPK